MTDKRFFEPLDHGNGRLHAPATSRNRQPIYEVLREHLPQHGTILELACGTGEHAAFMAPKFKAHHWLPTDLERDHLVSALTWAKYVGASNILTPRKLDVMQVPWPLDNLPSEVTAVLAINLIHIAPVEAMQTLIREAARVLAPGGILYFYGPFKRNGEHTAASNELFDQSLKLRNPRWGVRNLESVADIALRAQFADPDIVEMPANNLSVIFRKL